MREQKLLWSLLALNILFAAGCLTALFLSEGKTATTGAAKPAVPLASNSILKAAQNVPETPASPSQDATFGWQQVESDSYRDYLNRLRAAGCPQERIRQIVLGDIEELFAHKRLQTALAFDIEWWREEPLAIPVSNIREHHQHMEDERLALIQKHLGASDPEAQNRRTPLLSDVYLTGTVLGNLSFNVQQKLYAICNRSMESMESLLWGAASEKQALNCVQLARVRGQTRAELRRLLTDAQMEEFLLRFSHNAQDLRLDLRPFQPSPDEFRALFRVLDPLEHQLQLQYGDLEALSKKEREIHARSRDQALRQVLTLERYQAYLRSKTSAPHSDLMSEARR